MTKPTTCSIEGCEKSVRSRDLCRSHYYRWEKYGDPLGAPAPRPTVCVIEGCGKPIAGRGWCGMHWRRWRLYGDPLHGIYKQPKPTCSIEGCDDPAMSYGWCSKHYQRWKRNGDPLALVRAAPAGFTNEICRVEDCEKPTKALGWCAMHYKRWQDHGSLGLPKRAEAPMLICQIEGCEEPVECRGWCNKHYLRWQKHGDPLTYLIEGVTDFCSQDGCARRVTKSGVCEKHYRKFRAMFAKAQGGKCAICGISEEQAARRILVLDHDHVTGQPRALLCHHCNCGIGMFGDDLDRLRAAVKFLEDARAIGQLALFAA